MVKPRDRSECIRIMKPIDHGPQNERWQVKGEPIQSAADVLRARRQRRMGANRERHLEPPPRQADRRSRQTSIESLAYCGVILRGAATPAAEKLGPSTGR